MNYPANLIGVSLDIVTQIGRFDLFYPELCQYNIVKRLINLSKQWNDEFKKAQTKEGV